jgi:hypothetical protein
MTRVNILYDDQNETFAKLLPCTGSVIGERTAKADSGTWTLVRLDDPITYSLGPSAHPIGRILSTQSILIRSRWEGKRVGDPEPVSVFILLPFEEANVLDDPVDLDDFCHVAWGICTVQK